MRNNNEELIERIVHLMERDDSRDAPAGAVEWAKNLFRARAAEPKKSLVERVLAVLTVDLAPHQAAFGERSAGSAAARQMLFAAGDASVDLRIERTRKGFRLRGQILSANFAGADVALAGAGEIFAARADALGEFGFAAAVPAGRYEMTLRRDAREIVIENIEIG